MLVGFIGYMSYPVVLQSGEPANLSREDIRSRSINEWNKYLIKKISLGDSLKSCDDVLKGKYRDRCVWSLGGSGSQFVCYAIDDLIDVYAPLDRFDKVTGKAFATRRGIWITDPNGDKFVIEATDANLGK
jgi:hypothetical protein